jgi:hypothetical protein
MVRQDILVRRAVRSKGGYPFVTRKERKGGKGGTQEQRGAQDKTQPPRSHMLLVTTSSR